MKCSLQKVFMEIIQRDQKRKIEHTFMQRKKEEKFKEEKEEKIRSLNSVITKDISNLVTAFDD